jgi:Ca-activated chloride channel family protein
VAKKARVIVPAMLGWLWSGAIVGAGGLFLWKHLEDEAAGEKIVWHFPHARWLALGAVLVGWAVFHLRRHRAASFAYSRVEELAKTRTGLVDLLVGVPGALRMGAIAALAFALARPETFRTETKEIDAIDITIVFDLSKSMEEGDMERNRMDAAQRVVRKFVKKVKNDRLGIVVFAQKTMLLCPPTTDMKTVDRIIADMKIGDIPEYGTAIGDGLGMGLAQLKKLRDQKAAIAAAAAKAAGKSEAEQLMAGKVAAETNDQVIILLSDGDSNVAEHFDPDDAARLARDMKVKVFTVLIGSEDTGYGGGMGVNPATMRNIAETTGGEFFRATDQALFETSFMAVRDKLDKTKRKVTDRIPDKQLYPPFLYLAAALLALEVLLVLTRFRRFP